MKVALKDTLMHMKVQWMPSDILQLYFAICKSLLWTEVEICLTYDMLLPKI